MKFSKLAFPCILIAGIVFSCVQTNLAKGEMVTFFGDFEDGFGPVPVVYDSSVPYDPGVFIPVFHELVLSLPKFDPSLGTLTDITVFVDPGSPIFYMLGGGMTVTEIDDSLPDFSAGISLFGEVSLNYTGASLFDTILADPIPLAGGDVGPMGGVEFDTAITPGADGTLTGGKSIFASVDLIDFVGLGMVDTLFIDMIVEDTADFTVDNAMATASLGFDVFDGDSGADDPVIGITYTYVIPEPSTVSLLWFVSFAFVMKRKRS